MAECVCASAGHCPVSGVTEGNVCSGVTSGLVLEVTAGCGSLGATTGCHTLGVTAGSGSVTQAPSRSVIKYHLSAIDVSGIKI